MIIAWGYTGNKIVDARKINHIQCIVFSALVLFIFVWLCIITWFDVYITIVYIPIILVMSFLLGASIVTVIVKFQFMADIFDDVSLYVQEFVQFAWPLFSFLSIPMMYSVYKSLLVSIYLCIVVICWLIVILINSASTKSVQNHFCFRICFLTSKSRSGHD